MSYALGLIVSQPWVAWACILSATGFSGLRNELIGTELLDVAAWKIHMAFRLWSPHWEP